MKERPIPFSDAMVRAILDDRKTQTRRVAKLTDTGRVALNGHNWHREDPDAVKACPYGQPGDRLWVRERMRVTDVVEYGSKIVAIRVKYEADGTESDFIPYPERLEGTPVIGKCLAYGGFREASRILLEITNVRVERVQEISEQDTISEGITGPHHVGYPAYRVPGDSKPRFSNPISAFEDLWDSINAARGYGWDVNPWVWVIEFRRVKP